MKHILLVIISVILVASSPAAALDAQQYPAPASQDLMQPDIELLKAKKEAAIKEAEELEKQGTLKSVIAEMEGKKKEHDDVHAGLKSRYEELQKQVESLQQREELIRPEANAIAGPVRSIAQSVAQSMVQSMTSAEYAGRKKNIEQLFPQAQFPSLAGIQKLIDLVFDETVRNGKIAISNLSYTDTAGKEQTGEVLRIGAFTALCRKNESVGYLEYASSKEGFSQFLGKMPEQHLKAAAAFAGNTSQGLFIDPSGGGAFRFLADQSAKEDPVMDLVKDAVDYGIIWLLGLLSFIALWVAVERLLVYRKINIKDFTDKKSLELALTKKLYIIATIGSNAPYLGLMGTVLGIMITFATMGNEGFMDPGKIMTGLSLALKATAIGLIVAMPAVFFYNVLLRRAKEIMLKWEIENG
jgi:biopolymer transport protein ExbB